MQNDIKQGQKELYDKIKSNIGTSEIKVVFNKVDINFYPGDEDDEADYFEKQKDNTSSKLGCERENIYYVCFEPRIPEQMQALKNIGVLGFEDFYKELQLHKTDQNSRSGMTRDLALVPHPRC
jgi:predicted adenine nucleotide alpha hydrolase (AANH) superfamily ATPase